METKDELRKRFEELDLNKDGVLSLEEVRQALQDYAEKHPDVDFFSEGQIEAYMAVADSNQNGVVEYEEFLENMDLS